MVSGIPPVGITQNERFFSCDAVLLGVRYVNIVTEIVQLTFPVIGNSVLFTFNAHSTRK
jgi:hypothetical protein